MEKTSKKWFLKNIFRKSANKKEIPSADFSSDEEDAKAGFISADFYLKKFSSPKKKSDTSAHHNSSNGYHHHVYNPKANSEFCYFEAPQRSIQQQQQTQPELITPNDNEYHNFIAANRQPRHYSVSPRCFSNTELSIDYGSQASSQDEKLSCNSYNQQQHLVNVRNELNSSQNNNNSYSEAAIAAANKKTRAARNQRYYQRLLRDEGRPSTIYGCVYDDFNGNLIYDGSASIKSTRSAPHQPTPPRLPGPRNRGATLSDLDDYENILKVDEAVPPPIPPRDPNRRFSMHSSITKNPYYFDQALQKYVVINKQQPKRETSTSSAKPHYVVERKPELRSNSTNDLAHVTSTAKASSGLAHCDPPKSYQRYNKQRNLTITEGVKFPLYTLDQMSQARQQQQQHQPLFSSFEDINRARAGVNSSSASAPQVNHKSSAEGSRKSCVVVEKKTNLDDAINELEKMYSRLMSDECLLNMSDSHRRPPTLDDYSAALIRKYDEYEQEENRTLGEPDLVKDDVFSRNIQHANKMSKTIDQLPFGIPNRSLQPIPPKPPRDYLSIAKPEKVKIIAEQSKPDLIADDLAVRNLRRDNFANSRQIQSLAESSTNVSQQILSQVTQKLHLGILSAARRPSGGKRRAGVGEAEEEAVDSDGENRELEESLNALIIESKAISEKLEEDLSKMKATKSINRISSVDLLEFEKKLNQNNVDYEVKTPVAKSPKKETQPAATLLGPQTHKSSTVVTPQKSILKNATHASDIERVKMDVQMVSTACSPIRELNTTIATAAASSAPVDIPKTPTKSAFVRASSLERGLQQPQASPKISELIQMFSNKENATTTSSTTPIRPRPGAFKLTPRSKSIDSQAHNIVEPKLLLPEKSLSQNEFETNIENIRDLIKQMKKTEFDLATKSSSPHKKQPQRDTSESREPSTDFDQKSTTTTGTESINTTTSSLKTFESNESLPKITIRADELLTSAIDRDAIDDDVNEVDVENEEEEEENEVDDNNNREEAAATTTDEVVGEKIVLRDESCALRHHQAIGDVAKNTNEDETPADDGDDARLTLEEKVKKQLENISLNLEKFKDENATTTTAVSSSVQVLDAESLYNSTEELSMIFANAENYVSQGNDDDDELEVLDADFVAASEKEFEKLVLDCNNNNSEEIFDKQLLTNGDFALGMCPLSSVEAHQSPAESIINSTDVTDNDNACSTHSTTIPKTKDNKFHAPPAPLMKDEKPKHNDDGGGAAAAKQQKQPAPKKKPASSSATGTMSTFSPLSTLQEQAFALACVYFIILLTQLLTFN